MEIMKAALSDAEEILKLQKLAYRIEAGRYNDFNIPPLTQTLDELREQFGSHVILKAVSGGRIVGTVRAVEKDGTCYVGRLAVLPEMQNKGIGTALMLEIENYFTPERFELFTGSRSENNIHLYKKLGYEVFKTQKVGCGGKIEIIYMEKRGRRQK